MNNKDVFVESLSFCEIGFSFSQFEGKRNLVSSKYNFEVEFFNDINSRYKGLSIEYNIHIPFSILDDMFEVKSREEIEVSEEQEYIFNYIAEVRTDIEKEIFQYLIENKLTIEENY